MKPANYLRFDPEKLRKLPRPFRDLFWSIPIRACEAIAERRNKDVPSLFESTNLKYLIGERGIAIDETAVTEGQLELLLHSLNAVANLSGDVAEIGSWRGVTTVKLAINTSKTVFAIDPHPIGAFEGVEEAHDAFQDRIANISNIRYIRECSGEAFRQCSEQHFSMIFVDAMHDFVSVNFDLNIWVSRIEPGGLLALHDVDDHPGVNMALQRALKRNDLEAWGYCPNLAILKKV